LDINCKCNDGVIKCQSCNGKGVPKINKVDCSDCTGLVKSLEREIKSGDFKPWNNLWMW
jgi:DnaJ-class molecular chaperone